MAIMGSRHDNRVPASYCSLPPVKERARARYKQEHHADSSFRQTTEALMYLLFGSRLRRRSMPYMGHTVTSRHSLDHFLV